jgi:hypothetical protein
MFNRAAEVLALRLLHPTKHIPARGWVARSKAGFSQKRMACGELGMGDKCAIAFAHRKAVP